MQRRKYLAALGSLAAGGAAIGGTGAITQGNIERSAAVEIRADPNAFVSIEPGRDNPEYVSGEGDGTLQLDLSRLNNDSEFLIEDVLKITNDTEDNLRMTFRKYKDGSQVTGERVRFYADWDYPPTSAMRMDQHNPTIVNGYVDLNSGEVAHVAVEVSTGDSAPSAPHEQDGYEFPDGGFSNPGAKLIDTAELLVQDPDFDTST
jgi:hypothetical protein